MINRGSVSKSRHYRMAESRTIYKSVLLSVVLTARSGHHRLGIRLPVNGREYIDLVRRCRPPSGAYIVIPRGVEPVDIRERDTCALATTRRGAPVERRDENDGVQTADHVLARYG